MLSYKTLLVDTDFCLFYCIANNSSNNNNNKKKKKKKKKKNNNIVGKNRTQWPMWFKGWTISLSRYNAKFINK